MTDIHIINFIGFFDSENMGIATKSYLYISYIQFQFQFQFWKMAAIDKFPWPDFGRLFVCWLVELFLLQFVVG